MHAAYLEALNEAQAAAATHGVASGGPAAAPAGHGGGAATGQERGAVGASGAVGAGGFASDSGPPGDARAAAPGGPLLVIAGAGSGKTNTLAHRVAHLVATGTDPRRILLMTFSRRAAAEMVARAGRVLARALGDKARAMADALHWAGTFHAVSARLLREYAPEIGLDPAFTILDREDSADLMALVRNELGLSRTEKRFPMKGTCLAIYSRAVNAQDELEPVLGRHFPWCAMWADELRGLFEAYVAAKQRQGVLDYDDLLLYLAQLAGEPGFAAHIGARFDHVLVDEYQDTNRLQAAILMGIKPTGQGVTVVGDDAQSIYAFRAATVRNILDFPGSFDPPARIVTLEQNYRSTVDILAAANAVIALAAERFTKNLWSERASQGRPRIVAVRDETEQAAFVAETVLAEREEGLRLKDQAVLFRTSHHSGPLEVELTRRNIPYVKFGGLKFLDSAHVKDVLAVLRLAENPKDRVAGFRVLQILPGVGPATAARILEAMEGAAAPEAALQAFVPPAKLAAPWEAFLRLFMLLRARAALWPAELAAVRDWYAPHLERRHEDAPMRMADLVQLEQIAAAAPSRQKFLVDLTLDPPDATSAEAGIPLLDEDYLILSTIHSAKGQEWKSVYVLNVVDGCIPSDMSTGRADEIEEERRLLYVAMTRARDTLSLVVPQRFYTHGQSARGDRHVYAARSRFIPPALLDHFEMRHWPAVQPGAAGGQAAEPRPTLDISQRMRGMWRSA